MSSFASYDRYNEVTVRSAVTPGAYTTAQTGLTVDTFVNGRQAKTVTFIVTAGAVTDGTIDVAFEESTASNMAGQTNLPAANQLGSSPAFTSSTDDRSVAISVKPNKRYIRMNTVETVASAGYVVGAVAVLERS